MNKTPSNVYYRCIWLVRDSRRLNDLIELSRLTGEIGSVELGEDFIAAADFSDSIITEKVIERAEYDLGCIRRALETVPKDYRQGILGNIIDKEPFSDLAHPNTWKKWKQTFIYQLAKEQHLI